MFEEIKQHNDPQKMHKLSAQFLEALEQEMFLTASTLKETLDPPMIVGYQEALSDLRPDQIRAGFKQARKTLRWFPKPVEVRELCRIAFDESPIGMHQLPEHVAELTPEEKKKIDGLFANTAKKLGIAPLKAKASGK